MIKNYLLVAIQNFFRQKLFALINILGLAVALSVFILLASYVHKEYSYDAHWENTDRIYWLSNEFQLSATTSFKSTAAPYLVAPLLKEAFPDQIELFARVASRGQSIRVGEETYSENIMHVEKAFVDIYDFEVMQGSFEDTFLAPNNLAISNETADRYFGQEDPIGKVITLEVNDYEPVDYRISAVYKIPDHDTSMYPMHRLALLSETALPEMTEMLTTWQGVQVGNHFLFREGADIESMNERMDDFVNEQVSQPFRTLEEGETLSDFVSYRFIQIGDVHFDEDIGTDASNKLRVNMFALIGVILLIIGCINFIILATARANERQREVGVRKVLGARKSQLISQFLGESVLYSLVSLIIALVIAYFALPVFSTLFSTPMSINLLSPVVVCSLIALCIGIGVLSGVYPALILSGFEPQGVLDSGQKSTVKGSVKVRNMLVLFQFTAAIVLIISTLVFYRQLTFSRSIDPGFNPDNVFALSMYNLVVRENMPALANSLKTEPGISHVSIASRQANSLNGSYMTNKFVRQENNIEVEADGIGLDYEFFDVYQIPLIAGRAFSLDREPVVISSPDNPLSDEETAISRRIMVNRALTQALGFEQPEQALGFTFSHKNSTPEGTTLEEREIIGVVENSRFSSVREPYGPEFYSLINPEWGFNIAIRHSPAVSDTIREDIEPIWKEVMGDIAMFGDSVEENIARQFSKEKTESDLLILFASITVIISAMGLFGLATFTSRLRVKEVGVRKVLGAKSSDILKLFLWQFSKPVLLAALIACPLALWAILQWLQRFHDQISGWQLFTLFPLAVFIALIVAWMTVSSTTIVASRANPVESLRD